MLLVFLIGGNIIGVLLLLHLLSGDHCLLVHFDSGFALLLLVLFLDLLLRALGRGAVDAGLVAVALPTIGAGTADACPDTGLLPFQEFPTKTMI